MAVAYRLVTFQNQLPLETIDNAEWIQWPWVEMIRKKCASKVRNASNKERWGIKRPATMDKHCAFRNVWGNIWEMANTQFRVVIRHVLNSNQDHPPSKRLQASYSDARHWEELNDFIKKNCSPKSTYCLTAIFKCTLTQEGLDNECMGLFAPWQMMNDPLYGQILYNSCLCIPFRLKLWHNLKQLIVEIKAATGKDIADHIIRPAKMISTSLVTVKLCPTANQLTLTSDGSDENDSVEDEMAGGKWIGSSINVSSDWVNTIDYIPYIYWVQTHVCEIPNITMNFISAGVWAKQPNVVQSKWRRSLRMKRRLTNVHGRFRSKWMARRPLTQLSPVQHWALFSSQSKMNLNRFVLVRWLSFGMPIWLANWSTTKSLATCIQFEAYPEPRFWCARFGQYGSLWEDAFGIHICQERWWQLKWASGRCLPRW